MGLRNYLRTNFALLRISLPFCLLLSNQAVAQVRPPQQDIVSLYLFNGVDEATYKKNLEQQTNLRIRWLAEVVELDATQFEKFKLAASGDLSRFFRELSKVREKTAGLNPQVQADMQKAWVELAPLQQRIAKGLFDEDSLHQRVLKSMLSQEQTARYQTYLQERLLSRHQAFVLATVADLEKSMPLTHHQREELIKLVNGKRFPSEASSQQEVFVGGVMLTRLTAQETNAIFDAQQQKTFDQYVQQYAGYARNMKW